MPEGEEILYAKHQDLCKSHHMLSTKSQLDGMILDQLSSYRHCVGYLTINGNPLQDIFLTLLHLLPNLEAISLNNCKLNTLQGVGQCQKLRAIVVPNNHITTLHSDVIILKDTLVKIDLCGNPIRELPSFLSEFQHLRNLSMARTNLTALPENIGDLLNLLTLDLRSTMINKLPESFRNLKVRIQHRLDVHM